MWARTKKAHVKKESSKKPTESKILQNPMGQGQPMDFHLQHEKYIIICETGPTNRTSTTT